MAKIVYRQMPAPRELSQEIAAPLGQKVGCKSPRVGAKFWCKSPGVSGGMAMDEIDTCISQKCCLGTSTESFTGSSTSEQITVRYSTIKVWFVAWLAGRLLC